MQDHYFDNIYQVNYYPTREQASQLERVGGHRPDGKNRAARHRFDLIHIFFSVKNASALSKWHQSFSPLSLPIGKFITRSFL